MRTASPCAAWLWILAACTSGQSGTDASIVLIDPPNYGVSMSGIDTLVPPMDVVHYIRGCGSMRSTSQTCNVVVYLWSPLMPLSRLGIPEAANATHELKAKLFVTDADLMAGVEGDTASVREFAEWIAAGVTIHYPSMLVRSTTPRWLIRRR
jgi:hypothetical protein